MSANAPAPARRQQRHEGVASAAAEGSLGGPLSFPLLFSEEDAHSTPGDSGTPVMAAAAAAAQSARQQNGLVDAAAAMAVVAEGGRGCGWLEAVCSGGELGLIWLVLLLGFGLLANGLIPPVVGLAAALRR